MTANISGSAARAESGEGEAQALAVLQQAARPYGFVAAIGDHPHYQRVWARDGAVACLAALATGDAALIECAARTLDWLAAAAGPRGEIPSNVGPDGDASFGQIVGRVDAPLWYAIAAGSVARAVDDLAFSRRHGRLVAKTLALLDAWELNGRGLVPVPLGGDWADEYFGSGYLLNVQLLRLLALRLAPLPDGSPGPDETRAVQASALADRLAFDYWADPVSRSDPKHYHPAAYRRAAVVPGHFWLAGFDATGYARRFDALANVLAIGAGIGPPERVAVVLEFVTKLTGGGLIPAFDPIIEPRAQEWGLLRDNHRFAFRNQPGAYHNGGLWPWLTGLWAAAVAIADPHAAANHASAIDRANALGPDGRPNEWSFFEYHDARTGLPGGVAGVTWCAAGAIIARRGIAGHALFGLA